MNLTLELLLVKHGYRIKKEKIDTSQRGVVDRRKRSGRSLGFSALTGKIYNN